MCVHVIRRANIVLLQVGGSCLTAALDICTRLGPTAVGWIG
jgi:hypothetical protein